MSVNYITCSLLNSWLYTLQNSNADISEFEQYLKREKREKTEAQAKGLEFEKEVYQGLKPLYTPFVEDGLYQVPICHYYDDIAIIGVLDVLQKDWIYDIKTTSNYSVGKYGETSQHIIYWWATGIKNFSYLINEECYKEDYFYKKGQAENLINDFLCWLQVTGYYPIWKEKWIKTQEQINEYAIF
jgi:hypothetical protein